MYSVLQGLPLVFFFVFSVYFNHFSRHVGITGHKAREGIIKMRWQQIIICKSTMDFVWVKRTLESHLPWWLSPAALPVCQTNVFSGSLLLYWLCHPWSNCHTEQKQNESRTNKLCFSHISHIMCSHTNAVFKAAIKYHHLTKLCSTLGCAFVIVPAATLTQWGWHMKNIIIRIKAFGNIRIVINIHSGSHRGETRKEVPGSVKHVLLHWQQERNHINFKFNNNWSWHTVDITSCSRTSLAPSCEKITHVKCWNSDPRLCPDL